MAKNIFIKRNLSINQCWNRLFRFHHFIELLIFFEFIRRFLQILLNVVFPIIILGNLRKSLWIMRNQNNEKIETNNWTRLLIFDDKINFYFLYVFLYMTSVVYCRTFLHFMSSLFNNLKKIILKTYPPPK